MVKNALCLMGLIIVLWCFTGISITDYIDSPLLNSVENATSLFLQDHNKCYERYNYIGNEVSDIDDIYNCRLSLALDENESYMVPVFMALGHSRTQSEIIVSALRNEFVDTSVYYGEG